MFHKRSSALPWFLLLVYFHLTSVQAATAAENNKFIKAQQDVLEKNILEDFKKIKEKFNATVDTINKAMAGIKQFTDDSIKELETHMKTDLKARDAALDKNLGILEEYTHAMSDKFMSTMLENLNRLGKHTASEREAIIKWAHKRSHHHEDILKTQVALCAYDHGHHGNTKDVVVNYNSATGGFLDGKKNWQVFNKTCNEEACANEVLNRTTGAFKPPKNAAGLYMFTFSVTMDVWDYSSGMEPAEYQFRKNGAKLTGTNFYCDIGSSRDHDQVQGSKTILLKLGEADEVDVVQLWDTDIADSSMTFCGALIHLDKVNSYKQVRTSSLSILAGFRVTWRT